MLIVSFLFSSVETPAPATNFLFKNRFLGDMLRGWFKSLAYDTDNFAHWSEGEFEFGGYSTSVDVNGHPFSFFSAQNQIVSSITLHFNLFGSAVVDANRLLEFFANNPLMNLNDSFYNFRLTKISVQSPWVLKSVQWTDEDLALEPLDLHLLQSLEITNPQLLKTSQGMSLKFFTPLTLGSSANQLPPKPAQIFKNLAGKLKACEPENPLRPFLESSLWFEFIRSLGSKEEIQTDSLAVSWQYASRNQIPHKRLGWDCTLTIAHPLDANIVALLWLGQYLGVGQGTLAGQGRYKLFLH
jgi:CRISPR-associated endoribonuclease Cas6